MNGEIKDSEFIASLPISKGDATSEIAIDTLVSLPSRLQRMGILGTKTVWKGRLPPVKLSEKHYDAEKAELRTFPWPNQIVLEGHLCARSYLNSDGSCGFDRSKIIPIATIKENDAAVSSLDKGDKDHPDTSTVASEGIDEEDTCPVCRFMKVCKSQLSIATLPSY